MDINSAKNLSLLKGLKNNYNNVSMFNIKEDIINNTNNDLNISNNSKSKMFVKSFISNKTISTSAIKMSNNPNEKFENLHYDNIIEKFKKSLGLILLTIDSLNKFTNMKR